MTPTTGISSRIAGAMKARGMTLKSLSSRLGRSLDSIWRTKTGRAQSIDLQMLESLCRWCMNSGISLEWLILGTGQMQTEPVAATPATPLSVLESGIASVRKTGLSREDASDLLESLLTLAYAGDAKADKQPKPA